MCHSNSITSPSPKTKLGLSKSFNGNPIEEMAVRSVFSVSKIEKQTITFHNIVFGGVVVRITDSEQNRSTHATFDSKGYLLYRR